MKKFNWDDFPGYDKVAMDGDGCVYVFSGDIQYDFDEGVWFSLNPARNMLHVFTPSSEVLQGVVGYKERPDLPPDWWFEDQVNEVGITKVDFKGQEEGEMPDPIAFFKELSNNRVDVRDFDVCLSGRLDGVGGCNIDFVKRDVEPKEEDEQYIGAPGSKPTDLDVEEKTNRVWINAEEFNFAAYYYKMRHEDWMQSHESLMQHIGGKFLNFTNDAIPQDWTSNDTLDFGKSIYDKHAELARQSIWSHFEEFECLPDFLVGDTEVLGPYFMGIKIIDDEEDIC